jgi:hypothetical protein
MSRELIFHPGPEYNHFTSLKASFELWEDGILSVFLEDTPNLAYAPGCRPIRELDQENTLHTRFIDVRLEWRSCRDHRASLLLLSVLRL